MLNNVFSSIFNLASKVGSTIFFLFCTLFLFLHIQGQHIPEAKFALPPGCAVGDTVDLMVSLGTAAEPAVNITKAVLEWKFDSTLYKVISTAYKKDLSWMISDGSGAAIVTLYANLGKLRIELIRNDNIGATGYGTVLIVPSGVIILDLDILKLSTVQLSIVELETKPVLAEFEFFPNPAREGVHFKNFPGGTKEGLLVEIYSSQGVKLPPTTVIGDYIDVSGLCSGTYFLKCTCHGVCRMQRMVVLHE